MSDERERNEPGKVADKVVDRNAEGEPDFEGQRHANEKVADKVVDRNAEGEPDFEGHRFIDKQAEKLIEKHAD